MESPESPAVFLLLQQRNASMQVLFSFIMQAKKAGNKQKYRPKNKLRIKIYLLN